MEVLPFFDPKCKKTIEKTITFLEKQIKEMEEELASLAQGEYKLLLELAQHRPFLLEDKDCITAKFVWRRLHLLSVKCYQACINLIRFGNGEHDTGEVLYLQRIFKADGNACL